MRLPVNHKWPLLAATVVAAGLIASPAQARKHKVAPAELTAVDANGPSSDYPVTLGDSYSVGSTVFTPSDAMNLDAVGYASIGGEGGSMVSAAHHTMPVPSYAEVTSLDSGRTIVVRVDRRGPMDATNLIQLSPAAAAQLGLGADHAAVRVRRVNPPENERALLRAGAAAPERIPTPKALLAVLTRKLDADGTVVLARSASAPKPASPADAYTPPAVPRAMPTMAAAPRPVPASLVRSPKADTSGRALPSLLARGGPVASPPSPAAVSPRKPAPVAGAFGAAFSAPGAANAGFGSDLADADPAAPTAPARKAAPRPVAKPAPRVVMAKPADIVAEAPAAQTAEAMRSGMLVIQAGAFAIKGNAQTVASRLGANVEGAGKVWRVRVGPYASRDKAEAALAKVRAAGYSEARIQRAD